METHRSEGDADGMICASDFRGPAPWANRRVEQRIECTKPIVILPYRPSVDWSFKRVEMFDCSEHGLGILTDEPLAAGELFLAKLRLKKITLVAYMVRHCVKSETGGYKIGAWMTGLIGRPDLCDPADILHALLHGEDRREGPAEPK
jgi:hypothetical protein